MKYPRSYNTNDLNHDRIMIYEYSNKSWRKISYHIPKYPFESLDILMDTDIITDVSGSIFGINNDEYYEVIVVEISIFADIENKNISI
jgi:hypothetical protein